MKKLLEQLEGMTEIPDLVRDLEVAFEGKAQPKTLADAFSRYTSQGTHFFDKGVSRTDLKELHSDAESAAVFSFLVAQAVLEVEADDDVKRKAQSLSDISKNYLNLINNTPVTYSEEIEAPYVESTPASIQATTSIKFSASAEVSSKQRSYLIANTKEARTRFSAAEGACATTRAEINNLLTILDGQNEDIDSEDVRKQFYILSTHLDACAAMLQNHMISKGLLADTKEQLAFCVKYQAEISAFSAGIGALGILATILGGLG